CNISMVISVVLVTFVSLTFVGAAVLMQAQIGTMRGYWTERAQVGVYMCSSISDAQTCVDGAASEEQVDAVRAQLEGEALGPLISELSFDTREETYAKIVEQLGEDQASAITADQSFEVFWVTMRDPGQSQVLTEAFNGVPGVEQV